MKFRRITHLLILAAPMFFYYPAEAGIVKKLGIAVAVITAAGAADAVAKEKFYPKDPAAIASDCTPGRRANEKEMTQINQAEKKVLQLSPQKVFDSSNPNQYLIFIALDGTANHRELITTNGNGFLSEPRYKKDKCIDAVRKKKTSDNNSNFRGWPTNPLLLVKQLGTSKHLLNNIEIIYVRGVGTEPNNFLQLPQVANYFDQASGEGISTQVNTAYSEIQERVSKIKRANASAQVVFVTTGFSRGSAATRVLHNVLLERGVSDQHTNNVMISSTEVVIGASVLFDTVATQLIELPRQMLVIPPQIVQFLHVVALNEYRLGFPLTSTAPASNGVEVFVPGAHSDIGGSYTPDGISAVTLQMAINYLQKIGLPIDATLKPEYLPNSRKYFIHDSRWHPIRPFEEQLTYPRVLN